MREKREILVTICTMKDFDVDGTVKMIKDEYLKSKSEKAAFMLDLLNGEYEGIFVDFAEAFLRRSRLLMSDAEDGHRIADADFTEFDMEDLDFYISDLYDAMDCISGDYAELISLLKKAGFDYENEYSKLPALAYINDISYISKIPDDMSIAVDSVIASVCVHICDEEQDKVLAAYFANDDTEKELLKSKNFLTVGNSDLMLKICSTGDTPLSLNERRING